MHGCSLGQRRCYAHSTLLPPANEVWGKVIFLHLFVILFTGGSASVHAGIPPRTMHTPRDHAPPGPCIPPGAEHAGRYGQHAGGTHPTGMQSYFFFSFLKIRDSWKR